MMKKFKSFDSIKRYLPKLIKKKEKKLEISKKKVKKTSKI